MTLYFYYIALQYDMQSMLGPSLLIFCHLKAVPFLLMFFLSFYTFLLLFCYLCIYFFKEAYQNYMLY